MIELIKQKQKILKAKTVTGESKQIDSMNIRILSRQSSNENVFITRLLCEKTFELFCCHQPTLLFSNHLWLQSLWPDSPCPSWMIELTVLFTYLYNVSRVLHTRFCWIVFIAKMNTKHAITTWQRRRAVARDLPPPQSGVCCNRFTPAQSRQMNPILDKFKERKKNRETELVK